MQTSSLNLRRYVARAKSCTTAKPGAAREAKALGSAQAAAQAKAHGKAKPNASRAPRQARRVSTQRERERERERERIPDRLEEQVPRGRIPSYSVVNSELFAVHALQMRHLPLRDAYNSPSYNSRSLVVYAHSTPRMESLGDARMGVLAW